jgi:hypothetical protein
VTSVVPAALVVQPAVLPYRYGLLSAATVMTGAGGRWALGLEYESDNCTSGALWGRDWCGDPVDPVSDPNPADKAVPGSDLLTATPFTVYDGIQCAPVGLVDVEARARARLAGSEQRQAEAGFWTRQLAVAGTGTAPAVSGAAGLIGAVGDLEAALAGQYAGVGVIHAPRWVAPYAAARQLIVRDGAVLRTPLDTAWVFGSGYPNTGPAGTAPAAGHAWLYVTGAVVVRRSDVVIPATPATGALDRTHNTVTVIAERTYAVTHDCVAYAIDVDLTGEV